MEFLLDWLAGKSTHQKLMEQARRYFPDEEPESIAAIVNQHYSGLTNEKTREKLMLALIRKYAGDVDMLRGMVKSLKLDYRDALAWLQNPKNKR